MLKSFLLRVFFKNSSPGRKKTRAHGTAAGTALFRYLAVREKDAGVRGTDLLARHFLSPGLRLSGLCPPLARRLGEYVNPGAYHYVNARTRHIHRLLQAALVQGVERVVLLGAGYDSRPYRLQAALGPCRVFEVDFPATQSRKRRLLARAGIRVPGNLTSVPLDFNSRTLREALDGAGFQADARTFFIWEGVSFYLTPAAVDEVLRLVARVSAPGSSIVFDYVPESFVRGENRTYRGARSAACHRRMGEPYRLGFPDGQVSAFLAERGLVVCSDLGPRQLNEAYLRRADGRLHGEVFDYIRIVQAGIPSGQMAAAPV